MDDKAIERFKVAWDALVKSLPGTRRQAPIADPEPVPGLNREPEEDDNGRA